MHLRRLSRQSLAGIEQNFCLATLTNPLGIGPGAWGALMPLMAGAIHTLHDLGIMLNSSRLPGMEFPLQIWQFAGR